MTQALVAANDPERLRLIRTLLERTGTITVIDQATDSEQCLESLVQRQPDALFLDARIEPAERLRIVQAALAHDQPPLIALITEHHQQALQLFEDSPPRRHQEPAHITNVKNIAEALADTANRIQRASQNIDTQLNAIRATTDDEATEHDVPLHSSKLPVKDYEEGTVRLLSPASLICARRHGRRVVLYTPDNEFPTYFTINRLEDRLAAHGFLRANRGVIINLDYVQHLIPNDDGSYNAILARTTEQVASTAPESVFCTIRVSRSRSKALFDRLGL